MSQPPDDFLPFALKMEAAGLPPIVIDTFAHYFRQLVDGQTGMVPEQAIEPVAALPDSENFGEDLAAAGNEALPRSIILKLNGGLGTSMGLAKAKSLLTVKDELNFLEIIGRQSVHAKVPLVLMNSFNTRDDSLAVLSRLGDLPGDLPEDFLQHKVPKIAREQLAPASYPQDPNLEWCPPGHGDLYTAMITSGLLESLLAGNYRYAFVSNSDNLGAVMDSALLGYFVTKGLPFMMEVADRTAADSKGGHLARYREGGLLLRESAQCRPEDETMFQDTQRHRYFNTNNLWIDLEALDRLMKERNGILGLPMLRNAKTVNPRDRGSQPVYQLETAMGSAIEVFPGADAVRVPRSRFAPIKKTNDLVAVRSDNYLMTPDFQVIENPARQVGDLVVDLDPDFFQFMDDFEARFPRGAPSLLKCRKLTVRGDVLFGGGVVLEGEVEIVNESENQLEIPDGSVISGRYSN